MTRRHPSIQGMKKPDTTKIGWRVQVARKAAGLSQSDLGDAVGCTQSAIAKIEQNKNAASVERLVRIAEVLNVDVRHLIHPDLPVSTAAE